MNQSIVCVWCQKPLLDVEHAKKHVAEQCEKAPWRKQIKDLADRLAARLEACSRGQGCGDPSGARECLECAADRAVLRAVGRLP